MSANSAASPSKASAGGRGPEVRNVAVLGPFTVRDLTVFGATLILFIASLIPMFAVRYNLWNLGSLFFLGLGIVLPLILAALFVARRLAPDTKVRIGSLSVDQFGSVVASFAVAFFFLSVAGAFTPSLLVALIGALVLFAATVLASFIPFFAGDFLDREEVPAHIAARESAVPVRTPKAPKPAKPTEQGPTAGGQKAAARIFGGQKFGGKAAAQAPGTGAPTAGAGTTGGTATGAGISGAGIAPSAAAWPAANAASSAAASPETGPAAVVPSAEAPAAAPPAAVPPAAAEPATPAAEETQLDGTPVTAAAAAGAGTETGNRPASADAAAAVTGPAASATPATAVHPQVKPQEQVKLQEPIGATVDPASRPEESEEQPVHEAFWFAVAQHRTAVDERTGAPLFGIEPGGWVLALEDRGDEFLVQHTDGRVGVLRDLSNIERG
ncbi:hypothetical protein [Arthrobacter sp. Soil736]|uniref:hypothetical protein n=1 Tax=Arthrobacter sp. Soil736 TaxID=1736395 RepID=UPI001F11C150|nr:hypothetical protein [Arthrobacter sp. Soil736]